MVCSNCGLVNETIIDTTKTIQMYSREDYENKRINEPLSFPVGPRTRFNSNQNDLNPNTIAKFKRLSKIQRSTMSSLEQNLRTALPKLHKYKALLQLPGSIESTAFKIYVVAVKKKLSIRRTIDELLVASIYAAIRINKLPRTLEEIADGAGLEYVKVFKAYTLLVKEVSQDISLNINKIEPKLYLFRFVNDLGLSMDVYNLSTRLLDILGTSTHYMMGKDPKGIAAGAIYLATRYLEESKTQAEIARVARVNEATLRSRAKKISQLLDRL